MTPFYWLVPTSWWTRPCDGCDQRHRHTHHLSRWGRLALWDPRR